MGATHSVGSHFISGLPIVDSDDMKAVSASTSHELQQDSATFIKKCAPLLLDAAKYRHLIRQLDKSKKTIRMETEKAYKELAILQVELRYIIEQEGSASSMHLYADLLKRPIASVESRSGLSELSIEPDDAISNSLLLPVEQAKPREPFEAQAPVQDGDVSLTTSIQALPEDDVPSLTSSSGEEDSLSGESSPQSQVEQPKRVTSVIDRYLETVEGYVEEHLNKFDMLIGTLPWMTNTRR